MERKLSWKSDLIIRSRTDPVFFIEQVLGSTLWERQRDVCYSVLNNERTAVPACVDEATEILTELRGFQFFKDLNEHDKVASLVNGKLVFVKPTTHYEYDYEGDLLGVKSNSIDFLITPNHRCYVQHVPNGLKPEDLEFIVKNAEDVYGKTTHRFNSEIRWDGVDTAYDEKIYELFGFYCGDGSAQLRGYGVSIAQKVKIDYLEDLLNHFCSVFNITYRKHKEKNGYNYVLPTRAVWEFFVGNFGRLKSERHVPSWIKNSPVEKLRAFLKGFLLADGWGWNADFKHLPVTKTPAVSIYYEQLANDIQEVALKSGLIAFIRKHKFKSLLTDKGKVQYVWNLSFGTRGKNPWPLKKHWSKTFYKGKVYCVEVPSGLILIRRNGIYHWTGNSFGVGKTFLAARLALWWLFCYPKSKVISTAPTQRQVKDLLWAELRTAYHKSNIKLGGELLQLMLKISDDHFAVGFSTDSENMDKFSGYHAPYQMVIFDQAAGIEPLIWEAAEGLMTSEHSRWLAISNTAISSSEMANICMPDRKTRFGKWNVLKIKATESPNVTAGKNVYPGLVAYDWVKRREEAWGRDDPLYKIFVEAEFIPDSEMVVVPFEYITRAFENLGELGSHIEVGLDVARMGTDSTVWIARSGSKTLEGRRVTGNTTMQVVGETVELRKYLEDKYQLPVLSIKVDVIGLGAGVYDRLMELDEPAVAVNNAEVHSLIDKERYSNMRAEMAWAFRHRMEHFGVGLSELHTTDYEIKDYIRGDIQAMRYKITSQGKIQIAQKDEIRKFLGRSPDYWDALVLAYESPGGGPPSVEFVAYDPDANKDMSEAEWKTLLGLNVPIDHESFHEYFS